MTSSARPIAVDTTHPAAGLGGPALRQLLNTVSVIVVSLAAGYAWRLFTLRREPAEGQRRLSSAATVLQKLVMMVFMPAMLISTFWALRVSGGTLVLYPVIGAFSHLVAGIASMAASRYVGHGRKQAGSMFNCGTFTNITSFGGLVAFMYYGEAGYALSALFKLFEPVIYFSIGFPLAKLYSDETVTGSGAKLRIDLRALARDRVVMLPLLGIAAGAVLNWSGVLRPAVLGQLMSPLVMVSTGIMLVSVGANMRLAPLRAYRREVVGILAIKNVLLPVTMLLIGLALGYGQMDGGVPLRVLVTMGAMPVAFKSLVAASLYKLDTDLANLLWLASTAVFVVVALPLMYILSVV